MKHNGNEIKQIKKLKRKAEITRNAYFSLSKKYKLLGNWLRFVTLISASIVAILTFAEFSTFLPIFPNLTPELFKLLIGVLASLVFLLTVTEEFLNLTNKAVIYETPAKQLTTFIRTASSVEEYDTISDKDIEQLTLQYTMISESAPAIPDRAFYKAKQDLLKKIKISRALEDNPFISVRDFSRSMENNERETKKETNMNNKIE